jgi:hypothetical protein
VLLALCGAIFLPRAYLAVADPGMVWSDEIFQVLEQGHRLAFGYGLVPWEFKVGARSWLLPGAIAGVMRLLAALGIGSGAHLTIALKLLFAGLGVAACYPMLRAAYALGGRAALLSLGLLFTVLPVNLVYGSRVLAEAASAPCLAFGVWLLLPWGLAGRSTRPRRTHVAWLRARGWPLARLLAASALLASSTLLRYQNAVLLPPIVLLVACRGGLRPAAWLTLGMGLVLLAGGLLDWATWGRPFHSFLVYVRFNLLESGADRWGIAKRGFYLRTMLATNGPAVLLVTLGFLAGLRRTWPVASLAVLYLLALSYIAHKELRFLIPVLPLFLACGAVGLADLLRRLPWPSGRRRAVALPLLACLALGFGLRIPRVTFRDIGQAMPPLSYGGPTSGLVWDAYGERNRLFEQAAAHADLCGLAAPDMNPYWTGGYTYLHRRVPLLWSATGPALAAANYAIVGPGQSIADPRYVRIAADGPYQLLRREGPCGPPPLGSGGFGRLTPVGVPGT